jgi:hypothetical protein
VADICLRILWGAYLFTAVTASCCAEMVQLTIPMPFRPLLSSAARVIQGEYTASSSPSRNKISAKYQLSIRSLPLPAGILSASHTEDHRGVAARGVARTRGAAGHGPRCQGQRASTGNRQEERRMQPKTRTKAGGLAMNHNETLVRQRAR